MNWGGKVSGVSTKSRSKSREFLRLTTIEAGAEKGLDRSRHPLHSMIGHWDGAILPEVQRESEKSPEWKRFTDGLLEVAELQAGTTPGSGPGTVETAPLADMDLSERAGVPASTVGVNHGADPNLGEAAGPNIDGRAEPHAADIAEGRESPCALNVELINARIKEA